MWVKNIDLDILHLDEYITHLRDGEEGNWATSDSNPKRSVEVVNCSGGRYQLSYDGEILPLVDDVFHAIWYLKTGEWLGADEKIHHNGD